MAWGGATQEWVALLSELFSRLQTCSQHTNLVGMPYLCGACGRNGPEALLALNRPACAALFILTEPGRTLASRAPCRRKAGHVEPRWPGQA